MKFSAPELGIDTQQNDTADLDFLLNELSDTANDSINAYTMERMMQFGAVTFPNILSTDLADLFWEESDAIIWQAERRSCDLGATRQLPEQQLSYNAFPVVASVSARILGAVA